MPPPASGTIFVLALRAWVRYLVPFTVLAAIVLAPLVWIGLHAQAPTEAGQIKGVLRLVWIAAASTWIAQLVLVGGVAPAVRAVASGTPLSQMRALGHGIVGLVRTALPCSLAVAAIAVASLAAVVPGLVLLVLLSLTGASTQRGLPAPLRDSVAIARANIGIVVVAVASLLVVDLAIAGVAQLVMSPALAKKPTPDQLAVYPQLVRIVGFGLIAISPVVASLLAAIHTERS